MKTEIPLPPTDEEYEAEAHYHKCGFDLPPGPMALDFEPREGCGFEWRHARAEFKTDKDVRDGHNCPSCGRGPWVWQYHTETVKALDEWRELRDRTFAEFPNLQVVLRRIRKMTELST